MPGGIVRTMRALAIFVLILSAILVFFEVRLCFGCDIERCAPYRNKVEAILESEAVSRDFYFLMVAESRCTDKAVSDKGAAGFWQLMPATSRRFGCRDPHDLECATRAAARYIKHLQTSFHRFEDVIIAYNMGGHNYRRRGATQEARGLVWMVRELMKCHYTTQADTAKR